MFIQEFVKSNDRYTIVFAEEHPYTTKGTGGFTVNRSSFAFLYDSYIKKYVMSTWTGTGPTAAHGPYCGYILNNMVIIETGDDIKNVMIPEDGFSHRWASMIKEFIGDETATAAFNRLVHPLKQLEKHQLDETTVAPNRSELGLFKFFGRFLSFDRKKITYDTMQWSVQYGKIPHPTGQVNFAGFPELLNYRKRVLTTSKSRTVSYGQKGDAFVVQVNDPSDFYYLYLLKEQQKLHSTWSYKIKKFFGRVPQSNGFKSVTPNNGEKVPELNDIPLSALFPRK